MNAQQAYERAKNEFRTAQTAVFEDRSRKTRMAFSLAWNKMMATKVAAYGVPPADKREEWSRL